MVINMWSYRYIEDDDGLLIENDEQQQLDIDDDE
jgi:hypothetical protein